MEAGGAHDDTVVTPDTPIMVIHSLPTPMATPEDQNDTTTNAQKDPDNWTTGDEEMTGAQRSYLHTLAQEADEDPSQYDGLTKAEASKKIDELQAETGRGE